MSKGANLQDSSVLDHLSAEIVKFQEGIESGLVSATSRTEIAKKWLEDLRKKKLREIRRCETELLEAQRRLERCKNENSDTSRYHPCRNEEEHVHVAKINLRKVENEHQDIVRWQKRIDNAILSYQKAASKLRSQNNYIFPKARAVLAGKKRAIEVYSGTRASYSSNVEKGDNFRDWAAKYLFQDRGLKEVYVRPPKNEHMDPHGDGVGLTTYRKPDYICQNEDGEIEVWEFKSGYEHGSVSSDQLREYKIMRESGYLVYSDRNHDPESVTGTVKIDSINYLFETRGGAEAFAKTNPDVAIFFLDEDGLVQYLQGN